MDFCSFVHCEFLEYSNQLIIVLQHEVNSTMIMSQDNMKRVVQFVGIIE